MEHNLFQSWIADLRKEIQSFGSTQIDDIAKIFTLYKIAQNVLSLAAGIRKGSHGQISCNLMVYEPSKDQLRVILTHGFYYKNVFQRVFPLKPRDSRDRRGSCGIAFQTGEVKFVDDAQTDPDVYWEDGGIKRAQENMRAIINIPLEKLGVLNVDSRDAGWFVPHGKYEHRVMEVQKVATEYMTLYTIANPFLEQYQPPTIRNAELRPVPKGLIEDMALVERCLVLGVPEAAIFASRRAVEKICAYLGRKPTAKVKLGETLTSLREKGLLDIRTHAKLRKINTKAITVVHHDGDTQVSRQDAVETFQLLQEATTRIFGPDSARA